jgi:hypothetical protein
MPAGQPSFDPIPSTVATNIPDLRADPLLETIVVVIKKRLGACF